MTPPALIVCEPTSLWATALRQAIGALPLVETRSPGDAWQQLTAAPTSFLALAFSGQRRQEMAELVDRIGRRLPQARVVALLDRRQAADGRLARELGVIHVCPSPRQAGDVVRLAHRHLGRQISTGKWPAMHERLAEIWQTLPWNSQEGSDPA